MKKKVLSVLLALVLALSLCLVTAVPVAANPSSYSTDMGRVGWGGSLFDITDEAGLNWNPLEVEVTYADGRATFVITPPVAFTPEIWVNDNFWLVFDADNDGVEDFQVGYMTKEPGYTWPENPTEHWFKKTYDQYWSVYELVPGDWDVSATLGLDQFTASIPVSYLGGSGSDYGFQIGLVKHVHVDDWPAVLGDWQGDYQAEWSTAALIFVPLPSEGWVTEATPVAAEVYVDAAWSSQANVGEGLFWGWDAFAAIQDGIAAVAEGGTVNVAAGTYQLAHQEEIKIIDKSLTLLGAQADVPIVNGERAGDESIIRGGGTSTLIWKGYSWCVIRITHSDVVVNGFTIENGQRGIAIQGPCEGILISYNYIENNGSTGSHAGIFRDNAAADVTITHNYIASNPRGIATNGGATIITDNTFYCNGKGIDFNGGDPYSKYFPDYAEPKYPTLISDNTFTNDSTSITLRLDKCHQSITITGNDITGARNDAIRTWNVYDEGYIGHDGIVVTLVNPAIQYNNIVGSTNFGINNQVTEINLDAPNNWWGHASGPSGPGGRINPAGRVVGKGAAVSDNVDWDPWLPQPIKCTPHDPIPPGLKDHKTR